MKTIQIDFTDRQIGTLGRAGEHNNTEVVFSLTPELADCDLISAEICTANGEKIPVEGERNEESNAFTIRLTRQLTVEGELRLQLVGCVVEEGSDEPQAIAKSPVVCGIIGASINGIETECDTQPGLIHRIWAKVEALIKKIHTHDNKNTLDAFGCNALDNPITDGDFNFGINTEDWNRLKFQGDTVLMSSDGAVVRNVEVKEDENGNKFFRMHFNKPGLDTNPEPMTNFIDIPINGTSDKFDIEVNGSGLEIELPTGGSVSSEDFNNLISDTDERLIFSTTLAQMSTKECVPFNDSTDRVISLEPTIHYDFGEVENLSLDFAETVDEFSIYRNEYSFTFISGTTPTVLTLPSSVQWANELTVEANKRYEISIVDNIGLWCAVDYTAATEVSG